KRLGEKLELLLAESLRVAHASGALRTKDLARVTVDNTVQPKNISFPTDAKLLHAAIKGLTRLASKHGVRLRQSDVRIANRAAMMARRYAHAKQFNRHRRQLRILRIRLGPHGAPRSRRGGDWTYEGTKSSRPLLSQRSRRRCRLRRPECHRLQSL